MAKLKKAVLAASVIAPLFFSTSTYAHHDDGYAARLHAWYYDSGFYRDFYITNTEFNSDGSVKHMYFQPRPNR